MSPKKLLVVEDDPEVVEVVRAAFEDRDVETTAVSSGEEALNRLGGSDLPDAILLDVRLPSMTGLEMCRLLKERGVEVPVILTSSYTTMELTIEAMQEGAYDYLDKPLRPSQLVPLVEQAMKRDGGVTASEEPELSGEETGSRLVGKSPAILDVYKTIGRVARTNSTVLITGESGTGKELVARVLHQRSQRRDAPFMAVNCAAIPQNLLESELFGHEEGAFTGASQRRKGKFELAGEGTLFLDEVAEIPAALQPKLLRALEEREIDRLGGSAKLPVKARLVAATNRDLETAVSEGEFRTDLYYRLAVVRIRVPPLRDREGDVRRLVDHFVERIGPEVGRRIDTVAEETYEQLEDYRWPGNVRELRNVVERSLALGRGSTFRPDDLPELAEVEGRSSADPGLGELSGQGLSLEEVEKRYITAVLGETDGNQSRAAEILGIHRSTLHRKIDEYGISLPG